MKPDSVHGLVGAEGQASFSTAQFLNEARLRFEIAGGKERQITVFDFARQIAVTTFVGTHAQYARIDALRRPPLQGRKYVPSQSPSLHIIVQVCDWLRSQHGVGRSGASSKGLSDLSQGLV